MRQNANEQFAGSIDLSGEIYGSLGQYLVDGLVEPDHIIQDDAIGLEGATPPQAYYRRAKCPEF